MANWTDDARAYFRDALKRIEATYSSDLEESQEFATDIRLHLEAEVVEKNLDIVSKDEVAKRQSCRRGEDATAGIPTSGIR